MKSQKSIMTGILAVFLASCLTPYQPMGLTGGVSARQITSDTFQIVARGNGYTSSEKVRDFVLLKSAETAVSSGHTHFLIIGTSDERRIGIFSNPGTATTNFVDSTAFTTFSPVMTHSFEQPGQDALIRVVTPSAQVPVPGAIEAAEILRFVAPRLRRS
jgi:hypothetical protein